MIELIPSQFDTVLPLMTGIGQKVLPYSICEGINPGRIFVDRNPNPQIALVWSPVGYYLLAGDPANAKDLKDISRTLTEIFVPASREGGETGFIMIPSTPKWKEHLPVLLPGREVIEIYRRPHAFDVPRFEALPAWRERIPAGFQMKPVNAALADELGIPPSWSSVEDFLANGIGFALMNGEKIASACTTVFASREKVEIDVHTEDAYQRRGFAVLTASALIEECLKRGKQPNWECFWENEPSCELAKKLSFTAEPDYPVLFWEE